MTDVFHERQDQMFPTLTPAQIETVRRFGPVVHEDQGQVLYSPGDLNVPFHVVLSGGLRVTRVDQDGSEAEVTVHRRGQFTGEIDQLSERRAIVRGEMVEAGEVLRLDRHAFRQLLASDADISELLMRAFILRRVGLLTEAQGGVVILGTRHSADTHRLRQFLTRNVHPHRYVDIEDAGAAEMLERFGATEADLPLVLCRGKDLLRNPTNRQMAECAGIAVDIHPGTLFDVVVVGAGPAGLAAAVYAASEGLDVLVLEAESPGGQAGSSSKIENYLGFPTGISGAALAGRALNQAGKFGAQVATPRSAASLDCAHRPYAITLEDGDVAHGRTVVIASGARYRRLDSQGMERFEGHGIYYGASNIEAVSCQGSDAIVVGGGNSAGQAAVFLARKANHVHMLVRGKALAETMSAYLAVRIEADPNISLHLHSEVVGVAGEQDLERVQIRDRLSGEVRTVESGHLFVMIGAQPNTAWLQGCVALDRNGFVKAGADLDETDLGAWPMARHPHLLETNRPGVFVAGDVRSESVKRVASAVGEGSICVQFLHRVLGEEAPAALQVL